MVEVEPRPLFKKLNKLCSRALEAAAGACTGREHYELTVEHALLSILEEPRSDVALILEHFEADAGRLHLLFLRPLQMGDGLEQGSPAPTPTASARSRTSSTWAWASRSTTTST